MPRAMTWWKKPPAAPADARGTALAWQEAFGHHQAGRIDQAAKLYRSVLQQDPRHFGARHLLGVALLQQGQLEDARREIAAALEINPREAAAHNNLGTVWLRLGDPAQARACFEAALKLRPGDPDANVNLASLLLRLGEAAAAVAPLRKALAQRQSAPLRTQLGIALEQTGDMGGALKCYEQALALDATYDAAASNRAALLARTGRIEEARTALEALARRSPKSAEVHANLGAVRRDSGDLAGAQESLRAALKLDPSLMAARETLAGALLDAGDWPGARREIDAMARDRPRDPDVLLLQGRLAFATGALADAQRFLRECVEVAPAVAEAHHVLGLVLMASGDAAAARASHERASQLDPAHPQARWAAVMARLPAAAAGEEDAARSRASFADGIKELERWYSGERASRGHLAVGSTQPFYLAYLRGNHRDLLRGYGDLCARLMSAWRDAPRAPQRMPGRAKFVLGVVSAHVGDHSVWTAIARGWLERLDRGKFEVEVLDLRKHPAGLRGWVERIAQLRPDALLYPEIGMDAMTTRLAALRLAPLQLAAWGHPLTTGLPTIDAFVSADAMEPADAQEQYRERLVRLPGLGVYYEPLDVPNEKIDVAALGLPADRPLLLSPGLPFKYARRDDGVWAAIALRVPHAHLVFFEAGPQQVRDALRARLEAAFQQRGLRFADHASFVRHLSRPQFFALMRRSALFLDTLGFSGFNTAMQAVECELPVVTVEGDSLRSRFGAGILRELGLDECVAAGADAYVDLAVRLAQDEAGRDAIRARMRAARDRVFATSAPVRALEDFLLRSSSH